VTGRERWERVPPRLGGVRIELLGRFAVLVGDSPVRLPRSAQRLVALLATRSLGRHEAADLLWPEADEGRTSGSLRTALWRIQQGLPGLVDTSDGSALRLCDEVVVDLVEFTGWAEVLGRAVRTGGAHVERDLNRTLLPSGGTVLPGWYDDWVVFERERFRQLWLHGAEDLARFCLQIGRPGEAVQAVLSAIAEEPLRESAHRLLVEIDLGEGNRVEAFRHYRMCRDLTRRELGAEPSFTIEELLVRQRRSA
jgi:DNA-binding SARP family transcriptional activator